MPTPSKSSSVAEFHGLYGPFQVNELLLQKIWRMGAYDASRLIDHRGRRVEVQFPGRWNRLDGPDFKDAIVLFDGEKVFGDVEIHFAKQDWNAHGHQGDPAYGNVILHVVYHPCHDKHSPTINANGDVVPLVSLMEHLWHDIEEYATDDSLLASTQEYSESDAEGLHDLDAAELRRILLGFAEERWRLKRHFAGRRIDKLGWSMACHYTGLEIMGYSQNRIPMLQIAARFGIEDFYDCGPEIEDIFAVGVGRWRTQGVRPANYPRIRLAQYAQWASSRPCWPELLIDFAHSLPLAANEDQDCLSYRKNVDLKSLRARLSSRILDDQVSGSKLDTLVCDGFLPLLGAHLDRDYFSLWFHWFAGNAPDSCARSLNRLQICQPRVAPLSNGWIQSLLRSRSS